MRSDFHIEFDRPLRGVKMRYAVPGADSASGEIKSDWICGIRDKMAQDAALLELLVTTVEHIENATAQIGPQIDSNLERITSIATELGLAIAREVVGGAVADGLLDPSEIVLRCLRKAVQAGGDAHLRIELAPEDLDRVIAALDAHPELRSRVANVDFVPNANLGPACVEISSDSGSMVYDPAEVLDRICEEIRQGAAG